MADDVLDSWEDFEKDGVEFDLQRLNIEKEEENVRITSNVGSLSARSINESPVPQITGNSIRILKRPTNTEQTNHSRNMDTSSLTTGKQSYNLNNYVDCEPFYPKNITSNETTNSDPRVPQFPHITLEDSTRTQYVPQVKILKRPKEGKAGSDGSGKLSPVKNSLSNGKLNTQGKSYEEREANYAKVRLRIMGSAAPTYDENEESDSTKPANNTDNAGPSRVNGDLNTIRGQVDVPILRQPQGPDGSKGFTVKR